MKWTSQQEQAITDRGRSVIVSAAAGSGKTAVLVERLLQLLANTDAETRIRAEDIIVVTFTNDAAAQMKQRLYTALNDAMNALGSEVDEEQYSWLLQQQSALANANISTINAFCFNLIRENADLCGVSSQFRVAEPAQESIYVQNALQSVLDRWSRTRSDAIEQLFDFFCTRSDEELEHVILSVADYMKSLAFPEYWVERAMAVCGDMETVFSRIRHSICTELAQVLELIDKAAPFAQCAYLGKGNNKFTDRLNEDRENILFHYNFLRTMEMERILDNPLVHTYDFPKFPAIRKDVDTDSKIVFQQFREIYKKKYKAAVKHFLKPLHFLQGDITVQSTIIPILLELTQDYRQTLFEEKRQHNVLSFDDGERLALSLLGRMNADGRIERTELGEMLSNRYSLVMVDEYQDCNNKQDCLFKLLSRGCTATEAGLRYGENAFLVGDVKQSIYSFRQANPRNFMAALHDSTPLAECQKGDIARIYLNQNFRSSKGVIDFVNALFHMLMAQDCGEVTYDENEFLYFGAEQFRGKPDTSTTILLTENEDTDQPVDAQAECIAQQIADMLAAETPVYCRDNVVRPCRPKDFCILLRTKDTSAFVSALEARGIPAVGEEQPAYFTRPEIRRIYNLLRVLDNPLTDLSMAGVLVSPMFGFTMEDLTDLKLYGKSKRIYLQIAEFQKACAEDAAAAEEHAALYQKCLVFTESFERMRTDAEALPLEALLMRIYDETDLLSLQSLYEDAQVRRNNLQTFVRLAKEYRSAAQGGQCSIGEWLRYLDRIAAKNPEIAAQPQISEDRVEIKTIHKSKGLEYPFVFLAHLERAFSNNPSKAMLHMEETGLLGLRLLDRKTYRKSATAAYRLLLADITRRQRSEEMRLFYVAMTRPQQRLFLTMNRSDCLHYCYGAYKPKPDKEDVLMMAQLLGCCPESVPRLAAEANSMQEWILQFLLSGSEHQHLLHALLTEESCASELAEYRVVNAQSAVPPEEPPHIAVDAFVSPEVLAQLQQQLAFRYESAQSELVSKYSVTALSHPDSTEDVQLSMPDFLQETAETSVLRGAQRGTAVHKMLQYMDFSAAAQDIEAELHRLQKSGCLTAAEARTLTPAKLRKFFASALYQRIAASAQVEKEKQFFVEIGELSLPEDSALHRQYAGTDGILIGTMDLLFREADGWVLVDYKTDYAQSPDELTEKYRTQLTLYQKAAERILGEPVKEAYLYAFSLNRAIAVQIDDAQF